MTVEEEFHEAMLEGYRRTGRETGYWANYFNRDVKTKGGLAVAKKLLARRTNNVPDKGLQTLIDHGRAELSVEALVLSPTFASLFTTGELTEAQERLNRIPQHAFRRRLSPDQVQIEDLDGNVAYREGASQSVIVNAFERNQAARRACIGKHGTHCSVCRMSFREVYGEIGDGFIHVHHLKPLAAIRSEYELDPIKDLVPVCPNCHAMLHTHSPPLSVEELRRIMAEQD